MMTAFGPVTTCFIAMKVLSQRSDVGPCVFHILRLSLSLVSVISSVVFFFFLWRMKLFALAHPMTGRDKKISFLLQCLHVLLANCRESRSNYGAVFNQN